MTTVTAEYARAMAQQVYSPRIYTPTKCEEDPDTSRNQIQFEIRIVGGSYLRRHRQGHQSVEDGCRIQAQAHADQELVLPLHEVLAKCLGHGRRGTLERIYIGSPVVDPSIKGIEPVISQPF